MIETPFAVSQHFSEKIERDTATNSEELWFIFKDSKLLINQATGKPTQEKTMLLGFSLYLGIFNNMHVYAAETIDSNTPYKCIWEDIRSLFGKLDDTLLALAGKASQLLLWERAHQFCGQCGARTTKKNNERAKECKTCSLLFFPKICPVVIALIQKNDEVLLARAANFPMGFYSALAGFVESGETLEQCIHREVFEEVGLVIDNLHYFGSQPWPFPNSLMIGFTCQWKSGEIRNNPTEILDARWFKKDNLPLLPPDYSLSRIMIEAFRNDRLRIGNTK
jgi:NAD+ diphosphatase